MSLLTADNYLFYFCIHYNLPIFAVVDITKGIIMVKKFKNVNEAFKSEELFTCSDVQVQVETSTMFSVDEDGNPVKATEDVVTVSMYDNANEGEFFLQLNKQHALKLIEAIAKAASLLRDNVN